MVAVLLYWWLVPSPTGVAEFRRLKVGMTSAEVEAAIGSAPGYHSAMFRVNFPLDHIRSIGLPYESFQILNSGPRPEPERITTEMWTWDRYAIQAVFNKDNRAIAFYLYRCLNPGERISGGFFH